MPLTDEQKAAIATLKTVAKDDLKEATDALKTDAHDLFHAVHRAGFTEAEGRWKPKVKDAEEARDAAVTAKEEAETQLREQQAKTPDVAKLNEQWQAKLDKLKTEHATALETERTGRKTEREARKMSDLKAALVGKGLDPDYAEIQAQKVAGRIRYEEDGSVKLYDGDIPVSLADGKTPFDTLAEQVHKAAPGKFIVSNGDAGSGTQNGGGGGGGGSIFDKIRADAQKKQEEKKDGPPSIEQRLGMVSNQA